MVQRIRKEEITSAQIKRFRRQGLAFKKRSKMLSKKFGLKIILLDLNPHETAGRKFPKSALTTHGEKRWDVGHANTRTKQIFVDQRVPKRLQRRVILHEKTHLENPRASEKKVQQITKKKYGFVNLLD